MPYRTARRPGRGGRPADCTRSPAIRVVDAPLAANQAPAADPGEGVPSDPAQASVAGEQALDRGDCRTASDAFAVASQGASAQMASRATEVALECENIPAAWTAAQNWLKAAPKDPQAALVYATVALKLYNVPAASAAISTALAADSQASDRALVSSMQVLAQQSDATAAFAALNPVIDTPQRSAIVFTALGDLAVEAYDFKRAEHLVGEALQADPKFTDALRLKARIAVLRGDAALAPGHGT